MWDKDVTKWNDMIAEKKLMQKAATTNPKAVSVRTGKQRGGCSSPHR